MWSSNTTYNCSYYIEVEIVCDNGNFNGLAPFFVSPTIAKTFTPYPYPVQSINVSTLCAGTTYKFRAREVYPPVTFSPWTATFTFTTPGVFVQPTVSLTASPAMLCVPQTSQLNVTINNSCGGSTPTYSWTPAAFVNNATIANPIASPTATTTYTCVVTGGQLGCWTASNTVTITSTVPPVAGTATVVPNPICNGDPVTLTLTGSTGAIQWQSGPTAAGPWTNIPGGTTTPYVTAPLIANTCFQAEVTGCGVVISNVVCVTMNPSATSGSNVQICQGFGTTLNATGGGTYAWAPAATLNNATLANPVATPSATTTYTVTVTNGNCTASSTVTVTVVPLPVITFSGIDTTGCVPLTVTFSNSTPNSVNCLWNFGDLQTSTSCGNPVTHTYTSSGIYSVSLTITDNNGCVNTSTHTNMVDVYGLPVACFTTSPQPTSILNALISFADCSSGASSWLWSFGDALNSTSTLQNPFFTYEDTGVFQVEQVVCTSNGCCDSVSYTVRIGPAFTLFVPNAFTPNADGHNNEFYPKGSGLQEQTYSLWIYDRWGTLIFSTNDWNKHWNGKVDGKSAYVQEDVYVWKIEVKDVFSYQHSFVGYVTVVR